MTTPLVRLPSLDLIRGFVAVGRRMSITQAASDLCLTQSAVSRQIRALEEALGAPLLVRGHRSIRFTEAGERLFRSADSAVQQVQDVLAVVAAEHARRPVTISASIGVSGLWLLPRLGRFLQTTPAIDVRVAASNRVIDLKADGVDLAIRYCAPASAPPGAVRLFGETLVPVVAPTLFAGGDLTADHVAASYLLEYDDPARAWLRWDEWLSVCGWPEVRPRGLLRFNQYDQVIMAAAAGQGIALGREELIGPWLEDGRLVPLRPPAGVWHGDYAYWLIQAEATPRAEVMAVMDWLQAEAATVASAVRIRPPDAATGRDAGKNPPPPTPRPHRG